MSKGTVLITGSSKGLGRALALKFSKNNYSLILHGRNKGDLESVKKEVCKSGVECIVLAGDLKENKTIVRLAELVEQKEIDILINNAAIMSKALVEKIEDSEVDEVINSNLMSVIKLTKRIYSYFLTKKSGMIIQINSTGGLDTSIEHGVYAASKYGLKGFTDALRIEARPRGIRVLGVYPGGMRTTFHNRVGGKKDSDKAMDVEEVAEIIFNLVGYDSVHVKDIVLERMYR
ncbi:MAG: SDR family oxidoreductase [Candidatus Liptonbacteria bacterium]|nr:SDR family oxidoreductase [Candidatus Pacearchaeota archaeon]MBM3256997.1 SDR family oxidoreductase [Candidatus Liptonbacteria bacterium]